MVDAVDLDHELEPAPIEVQEVASLRAAPQDLSFGLGQAAATQLAGNVELPQ
jgi:hypothetical protein